jgi:hypothetical protein
MIAAFEGWNDAGDAATSAVAHLSRHWGAEEFAEIDPEDFYDFTATRPHIRLHDGVTRSIDWPRSTFAWSHPEHTGGVVLLRGVEPQLKWRTFCAQVLEVATSLDCSMVLTLGALLAEVAHSRPTPVFGNAYDPALIERLALEPSRYEGPTGIVGVLHTECAEAGLDSASLWAALVERATALIGATVPTMELTLEAAGYEHEITQLVAEDDATVGYVRHLEEQHDHDAMAVQSADDLAAEVERFLREQEK